jgi:hypothetical protein
MGGEKGGAGLVRRVRKKGERGRRVGPDVGKRKKGIFPFMSYKLMNLKRDSKGIIKRSF